jgi:hypothetical protein
MGKIKMGLGLAGLILVVTEGLMIGHTFGWLIGTVLPR